MACGIMYFMLCLQRSLYRFALYTADYWDLDHLLITHQSMIDVLNTNRPTGIDLLR